MYGQKRGFGLSRLPQPYIGIGKTSIGQERMLEPSYQCGIVMSIVLINLCCGIKKAGGDPWTCLILLVEAIQREGESPSERV